MGHDATPTTDLLYPQRTTCVICTQPLCYVVLDLRYCSYACAGVSAPDASEHPASCWTWDGKPKMTFSTPRAARRMCGILKIPGVRDYYCPCHHAWHIGYSEGTTERETG